MGTCKDCVFCRKTDDNLIFNRYYCIYSSDVYGRYRYVEGNATCNNFRPRSTPENSGYTGGSSSSGCFLTSACVDYMGKADDCEELTALRAFRDSYMTSFEAGKALVEEYYRIAPAIVEKINQSNKKAEYYAYIYEEISLCLVLIKENQNELVLERYQKMVINLKNKFEI